jgi:carboxypeptidase C (cathepsin A)
MPAVSDARRASSDEHAQAGNLQIVERIPPNDLCGRNMIFLPVWTLPDRLATLPARAHFGKESIMANRALGPIVGQILLGLAWLSALPATVQAEEPSGILKLLPRDSVTEHTMPIAGQTRGYTATTGTLDLYGQNGEKRAAIFYTAYVVKGFAAETRPVTFVFNGGPGAASAYLHLGLAGPKVIEFGASGRDGANVRLRDNRNTWLDFTDLVFIDPVGTGWSRAAKTDEAKSFYNVQADAQSVAKTIALYVARNGRGASPKYLLGESYGGFRAVKVARVLQQDQGIVPAGIVALSPLLEAGLQFNANRFALGAALQLPSLAAAELERRGAFSPEAMKPIERFAMTEYLTTLAGPPPQGEAAQNFYARVAGLTGLPVETVGKARGFVRDLYVKNMRRAEGEVVSPYDASFAIPDPFPESDSARNDDPVLDGFTRALAGAFVAYAHDELRYPCEMTYILLARDISGQWDWQRERRESASAAADIREMLALNPSFKMTIAHGYSDMVTPYGVSRYLVEHLPPLASPARVQLKMYRGGHMFYYDPGSRAAFAADMRAFYALGPE